LRGETLERRFTEAASNPAEELLDTPEYV